MSATHLIPIEARNALRKFNLEFSEFDRAKPLYVEPTFITNGNRYRVDICCSEDTLSVHHQVSAFHGRRSRAALKESDTDCELSTPFNPENMSCRILTYVVSSPLPIQAATNYIISMPKESVREVLKHMPLSRQKEFFKKILIIFADSRQCYGTAFTFKELMCLTNEVHNSSVALAHACCQLSEDEMHCITQLHNSEIKRLHSKVPLQSLIKLAKSDCTQELRDRYLHSIADKLLTQFRVDSGVYLDVSVRTYRELQENLTHDELMSFLYICHSRPPLSIDHILKTSDLVEAFDRDRTGSTRSDVFLALCESATPQVLSEFYLSLPHHNQLSVFSAINQSCKLYILEVLITRFSENRIDSEQVLDTLKLIEPDKFHAVFRLLSKPAVETLITEPAFNNFVEDNLQNHLSKLIITDLEFGNNGIFKYVQSLFLQLPVEEQKQCVHASLATIGLVEYERLNIIKFLFKSLDKPYLAFNDLAALARLHNLFNEAEKRQILSQFSFTEILEYCDALVNCFGCQANSQLIEIYALLPNEVQARVHKHCLQLCQDRTNHWYYQAKLYKLNLPYLINQIKTNQLPYQSIPTECSSYVCEQLEEQNDIATLTIFLINMAEQDISNLKKVSKKTTTQVLTRCPKHLNTRLIKLIERYLVHAHWFDDHLLIPLREISQKRFNAIILQFSIGSLVKLAELDKRLGCKLLAFFIQQDLQVFSKVCSQLSDSNFTSVLEKSSNEVKFSMCLHSSPSRVAEYVCSYTFNHEQYHQWFYKLPNKHLQRTIRCIPSWKISSYLMIIGPTYLLQESCNTISHLTFEQKCAAIETSQVSNSVKLAIFYTLTKQQKLQAVLNSQHRYLFDEQDNVFIDDDLESEVDPMDESESISEGSEQSGMTNSTDEDDSLSLPSVSTEVQSTCSDDSEMDNPLSAHATIPQLNTKWQSGCETLIEMMLHLPVSDQSELLSQWFKQSIYDQNDAARIAISFLFSRLNTPHKIKLLSQCDHESMMRFFRLPPEKTRVVTNALDTSLEKLERSRSMLAIRDNIGGFISRLKQLCR
ncbi:hypothetical protein [Parashewanella tropica]|uniref:hypothetical protein n=1 Tax=Parashewanella tropica TaxID=2547970 RepID=UPI001059BF64|nr:hypothetical protein [Parashewanella tropica]